MQDTDIPSEKHDKLPLLALGALGVVFGDIGTSPLYALKECFTQPHGVDASVEHIFGVMSLIFWSLILIVSVKYLLIVLRADNQGEGGILALLALARGREESGNSRLGVVYIGLFGAALLYGDGMITPAISVLSAVEGLEVAAPSLHSFVLPITVLLLTFLFLLQRSGTARIGIVFGPIILLWFITLGVLGIKGITLHPDILGSIYPGYALEYLFGNGWHGFLILGSVFLAVTGAEALYADMGHFGKNPIRLAWFSIALPALVLNYFGQAALLIVEPKAVDNPFFSLAPQWFQLPLVFLATVATVIASQALISGAFSLTSQAIQLGYLPRMSIHHTSSKEIGQIYVPFINGILLVSTVLLVIGFGSSSNLAAAYGIAVSCTMLLTTMLVFLVMKKLWRWSTARALAVVSFFLLIETAFFVANAVKFTHGGWFPILVGAVIFTLMTTWRKGRRILYELLREQTVPFDQFIERVKTEKIHRVPGTAVFMFRQIEGVPPSLIHNLRHNKVLHERVVILTVLTERRPTVSDTKRIEVTTLGQGFYRMVLHLGFMERPEVLPALRLARTKGLMLDIADTTFFLGSETLLPTDNSKGMAVWREHIFALMVRNAQRATQFFDLPPHQVIEVGLQVEM